MRLLRTDGPSISKIWPSALHALQRAGHDAARGLQPGSSRRLVRAVDILIISQATIYRHIWKDKKAGGTLHVHLRQANKRIRNRYGVYDSRGRLARKRRISTRPAGATNRSRIGHWRVDTVLGDSQAGACMMTLVERKTGFVVMGKLARRTANGLIRQYLPKGVSVERLSQADCDQIATRLTSRPRERFNWQTPEELYVPKR